MRCDYQMAIFVEIFYRDRWAELYLCRTEILYIHSVLTSVFYFFV